MGVQLDKWSDRFGGLKGKKPFDKEMGTKSGQTPGSLSMFGMIRFNVAINLLENSMDTRDKWADEKRRLGCLTLLDAIKTLLDARKWPEAFEAAQVLKKHMQQDDCSALVDGQSVQAKIIEVAAWKPVFEIGQAEIRRTIAETKTIVCEFVVSDLDRAQFLKDLS